MICFSLQVNKIKTPKQIDELIEIESDTGTWYRRCFVRIRTELYGVSNKSPDDLHVTLLHLRLVRRGVYWTCPMSEVLSSCPRHLTPGPQPGHWIPLDQHLANTFHLGKMERWKGKVLVRPGVLAVAGCLQVLSCFVYWHPGS